jgi:hypothetical protein
MPNTESGRTIEEDERPALMLDVDGVLNRCAASGFGLEEDKLELLKRIVTATKCRLILSSSWREYPTKRRQLIAALGARGMFLSDLTPVLVTDAEAGSRIARARPRWEEIKAWLNDNSETTRFVILDDEKDFGPLSAHHVQTWSEEGLTADIAEAVIRYLSH